jgi:hypothetical protein
VTYSAPQSRRPVSLFITPGCFEAGGYDLRPVINATAWASAAIGTANLAIYVPFVIESEATFVKAFWLNGATAAGNVDVALYSNEGSKIVGLATPVAQGTINVLQEADITDTTVGPGRYYIALSTSLSTATFFAKAPTVVGALASFGYAQQTSAHALPATATMALSTTQFIPMFGLARRLQVA